MPTQVSCDDIEAKVEVDKERKRMRDDGYGGDVNGSNNVSERMDNINNILGTVLGNNNNGINDVTFLKVGPDRQVCQEK